MKHLTQAQRLVGLAAILLAGIAIAYAVAQYGQSLSELPSSTPPTATEPTPAPGTTGDGGCVVGGCSGELCTEAGDEPALSACIYRPEYACYASSTCARQASGSCGWTQTAAFTACLDNPPSEE